MKKYKRWILVLTGKYHNMIKDEKNQLLCFKFHNQLQYLYVFSQHRVTHIY